MSSSDSLSSDSEYVESGDDGPFVKWGALGQVLAGTLLAAGSFVGIRIYRAIFGGIAWFFGWIGDTLAGMYGALGNAAVTLIDAAFATATASITAFGILAPTVGITIALATMWIYMRDSE